jgi:hypothetical protein
MYRHARRFVHYGKLGVFAHNVQWNIFRQRPQGRLRRCPEDSDTLTAAQA